MINYVEPIAKKLALTLTNTAEYFSDNDDLQTFNMDQSTGKYDVINPVLSNGLRRSGWRNNSSAGLRWTVKKVTITPAVNFQFLDIRNRFLKNPDINQHFFYVLPSLVINWKQLYFSYRSTAQEPNATDLQPVVDNSNPLYLQLGNPSLQPSLSHNVSLNFNKYNTKNGMNYSLYLNGNVVDDAVIRRRTVDEKGVQVTDPINVDGIWRFYSNFNISKQFKFKSAWQLSLRAGYNSFYNKSIVIVNSNRASQNNWNLGPSAGWSFNYKDKFEFNQRYSIQWNSSKYDSPVYPDLEVISHYSTSDIVVRLPKHWVWESSVDYLYNPQVAPGIRKSNFRWNAGVNFLFLKDDKGQLKLSVYDLLNQNISVYRSVTQNYIMDSQTTILKRYFLLTFTYNIRNFGGGAKPKVGGRERLFFF